MKRIVMAMAMAVIAGASVASAQNPPAQAPDSGGGPPGPPMMQGPGPEQLRMRIEERWDHRVQTELALSDQQMDRLRAAERANQDRHTDLRRREEDLHRTVMQQLQPGVAADNSALSNALDQLAALRVQRAQSEQQLLRDLSFLTPVQRARYFIMAQRFQQMIEQFRRGALRPGMAPGAPRGPMPGRPFQQRMQPARQPEN